jgi:carboxyl-terminal processing protease
VTRTRRRSPRWLLACFLIVAVQSPQSARAQQPDVRDWKAIGPWIVESVRDNFYDAKRAKAWAEEHAHYADRVESGEAFATKTKAALAELHASHTAYYMPLDQEYYGLRAIFSESLGVTGTEYESIGVDFDADHLVRTVFASGPGDRAGLRRGDRVLKADSKPFHPILSFRGRAEQPVVLDMARSAEEHRPEIRIVIPRKVNPKREWLEAQKAGMRLIRREEKTVAYVPLFACAGDEYESTLREAIAHHFRRADAFVLDFRNGWGGCNPGFLTIFDRTPPILTIIGRDGKANPARHDAQWRKPLYVLINSGTRSSKEMVAFAIQKHKLGTLVGEKTAGAVLEGHCFRLSNDSLLYLAVTDVLVDGERLEGRGVKPDIEVEDPWHYANGKDPQLDKAIELAAGKKD